MCNVATAPCMLYTVCCMLYAVCCMLYAVCCMLYAVCCMLYAVCCMLYAACCMLYDVCFTFLHLFACTVGQTCRSSRRLLKRTWTLRKGAYVFNASVDSSPSPSNCEDNTTNCTFPKTASFCGCPMYLHI